MKTERQLKKTAHFISVAANSPTQIIRYAGFALQNLAHCYVTNQKNMFPLFAKFENKWYSCVDVGDKIQLSDNLNRTSGGFTRECYWNEVQEWSSVRP